MKSLNSNLLLLSDNAIHIPWNEQDISNTLASFKVTGNYPGSHRGGSAFEESTRDPDVWPPPTPLEQKYGICLLMSCSLYV